MIEDYGYDGMVEAQIEYEIAHGGYDDDSHRADRATAKRRRRQRPAQGQWEARIRKHSYKATPYADALGEGPFIRNTGGWWVPL